MSNTNNDNSEATAANMRFAVYEKRKVEAIIAARQGTISPIAKIADADPVAHQVEMARRHGAHGWHGDPIRETAKPLDDGSDILALAKSVQLKGFGTTGSNDNMRGIATSADAQARRREDVESGAAEVLDLAIAVGLKGFVK